jgi:hypothetical protein
MLVSVSATKAAFTSDTILAENCSKTKPKATTTTTAVVRFTASDLALLAVSAAVTTTVIAVAKVTKNCSS